MTGVEQMVERILQQAGAERDRILEQTAAQTQQILEQAQQQAQEIRRQQQAQIEKQAAETVAFAHSAATLIRRNALLAQRRQIVAQTLQQMLVQLHEMPAQQYFELLEGMIVRAAQTGEATLYLNGADLARLPQDFAARIVQPAPDKRIVLSDQPVDIDGGFVLRYTQTDMDCSFSSLLEEKREQLEDLIQKELFAG